MRSQHLLLLALLAAAVPLEAQERPNRGKIDGVERDKDKKEGSSEGSGGCDCGWLGWFDFAGDALGHIISPRGFGRGYQSYPYAEPDLQNPFSISRTEHGRRFGTVSASYFDDAASTLRGARFGLEFAASTTYFNAEFNSYREPLATETDRLYTWRVGAGVLPRLGGRTLLRAGFALRGLVLDDGTASLGPEIEAGAQYFVGHPFALNVTGRLAHQEWESGGGFTYREVNTTASAFFGRLELQAGWHWTKIGGAAAFGGPIIGTRVWF